jgi:hypothetical protein
MEVLFADSFGKSLKRLVWHQNPIYKVYELFRYKIPMFFENLWFFRKSLWEFRSWDYSFNLQMLGRSLEKTVNTIEYHGHEVDDSRMKKVQKMKRVIELLGHLRSDSYIEMAEKELGKIKDIDWNFEEVKDNPDLFQLIEPNSGAKQAKIPFVVVFMHLLFLLGVVVFAHDPVIFIWLLLFFIGYTTAYPKHQNPLILKEALLVGFFLAGLVVLGALQGWWLQPILEKMSPTEVFYGSLALTAITDNAALTYLGSLVTGTTLEFKLALVGGAVAGGGLTVIANAPNPAGIAILRQHFPNGAVSALYLLIAALPPTVVAILAYRLI